MGNFLGSFKFMQPIECCQCKINLRHYGNNYLVYVFGKGKYHNKYYCVNCLNLLINRKDLLKLEGKNL